MSSAALRFEDPLVSEAHALVSLRGRRLKLLALRGWLEVEGRRTSDVELAPGQLIALAKGVTLEVERVDLPSRVLALTGFGQQVTELSGSVYSVIVRPPPGLPELKPGFTVNAAAYVWSTTDGWRLRIGLGTPEAVRDGALWDIEGVSVGVVSVPISAAGANSTVFSGRFSPPLRIIARYETVHILPEGGAPVVISGVPAHILSELASYEAPAGWEIVAAEVWKGESRPHVLRQNWDRNLRTLRAKLRAADLREDLVRPDGKGNVELFLLPGDEVVNEC